MNESFQNNDLFRKVRWVAGMFTRRQLVTGNDLSSFGTRKRQVPRSNGGPKSLGKREKWRKKCALSWSHTGRHAGTHPSQPLLFPEIMILKEFY